MATIERESTAAREHGTLTRDQLRAELEERTSREFGLPLDEFLARLHAGDLDPDSTAVTDLAFLARMLERAERAGGDGERRRLLARLLARLAG